MDLSIVIPLHNEERNIGPLVRQILGSLKHTGWTFEVILVDDGSTDRTFEVVEALGSVDPGIRGARFRRHFGQTAAIKAGLDLAGGEICITMDGDLQHDPADIPRFMKKVQEGYDLVCGRRAGRRDGFFRWFPSKAANTIARVFSGLSIRDFGSTFRAYRRDVVTEIPLYGEMHRFIPIFVAMRTDRITEIPITLRDRVHGRSHYGLARTFKVLSDLILALFFSGYFSRPIHLFGYVALALGLPGFLILAGLSWAKWVHQIAIMDYGPLFFLGVLLILVSGQVFTAGIVCEYLVRVYFSNSGRKPYSIRETTPDPFTE